MNLTIIVNDFLPKSDITYVENKFKDHNLKVFGGNKLKKLPARTDILVTLGGDGTILKAAELVYNKNIPIFAINKGKVGALSNFPFNNFSKDDLFNKVNTHSLLTVKSESFKTFCLNEFAINRDVLSGKAINIAVNINKKLKKMLGDGLVISTKQGSTGYNAAAGGTILNRDKIAITPLASKNLKPFSTSINSFIKIKIHGTSATLVADSRRFSKLKDGAELHIFKDKEQISFISK